MAARIVAAAAESKSTDVDSLKAAKAGDKTVEEVIAELSAKIGEKLELRRAAYFDGTVETYLHKRSSDLPRRSACSSSTPAATPRSLTPWPYRSRR